MLLVGMASAGEANKDSGDCAVSQQVAGLLVEWKAAAAEAKAATPAQRQQFATRVAALKAECPVGCRLGGTVATVRDALGTVIAMGEACAEECPIAKAEKAGAQSEACRAGKELKVARATALTQLHELASYVAGVTADSECCAKGNAASATGVAASATQAAGCDAAASSCPIRLASRMGGLKASWDKAQKEASALPLAKKKEILAGFQGLGEQSKGASLVGPSVLALAEGLEGLHKLHGNMFQWAQTHPDILKDVPASTMQGFLLQTALIDEARGVLKGTTQVMKTMHGALAHETVVAETAAKS